MIKKSPFDSKQDDDLLFVKNYKLMTKKFDFPFIGQNDYLGSRQHSKTFNDPYLESRSTLSPSSSFSSSYVSNSLSHSRSAQMIPRRRPTFIDYQRIRLQQYEKQSQLLNIYGPQALRYNYSNIQRMGPYYLYNGISTNNFNNNSMPTNQSKIENTYQIIQRGLAPYIQQISSLSNENFQQNNRNMSRKNNLQPYRQEYNNTNSHGNVQYGHYVSHHNPQHYLKQSPRKSDSPNFNIVKTKQRYDSYQNNNITSKPIDKNTYNTVAGYNYLNPNDLRQTNRSYGDNQNPFESSNSDLRDSNWKSGMPKTTNIKNSITYDSVGDEQSFRNPNIRNSQRKSNIQFPDVLQWQSRLFHKIT